MINAGADFRAKHTQSGFWIIKQLILDWQDDWKVFKLKVFTRADSASWTHFMYACKKSFKQKTFRSHYSSAHSQRNYICRVSLEIRFYEGRKEMKNAKPT